MKKNNLLNLDLEFWKDYEIVAGLDEAGRGAIAGPLVVCGVIMPNNFHSFLIKDSKKLSPRQRERAFLLIKEKALEYRIIFKSVKEVEEKNPLQATKEAMKEIILSFKKKPSICLIDGKEEIKVEGFRTLSIISADDKSINVAAASIIAKVTRDNLMKILHEKYPIYQWIKNKGYADKIHIKSLLKNGFCEFHRRTYEPVKSIAKKEFDIDSIYKKYKLIDESLNAQ